MIDVHAHYYPDELLSRMRSLGSRSVLAVDCAPSGQLTLDERLSLLDETGIRRQVLSVGILTPDFAASEAAIEAARLANDLYADVCHVHPSRFSAFGALPLPHVQAARLELERCLDRLGMVGITLGCSVAGQALDDPAFAPVFKDLDRRAAVVFLHPVGAALGPQDLGLQWMVGPIFEDTIAALRLVLSGMTTRYPRVRFIVPHLGGALPFVLERIEFYVKLERDRGNPVRFEGSVRDHLRRFWYDTVNLHPAALHCARLSFGANRLLLGTDFPFQTRGSFCACVSYLRDFADWGDAESLFKE